MAAITEVPHLCMTPEVQGRVDCNNYHCIEGNKEENIFAAIIIVLMVTGEHITPKQFLTVCVEVAKVLYAGIQIDLDRHPRMRDSRLLADARAMKGFNGTSHLSEGALVNIANRITGNDRGFEEALKSEISLWEARLLFSQFFPS